MTANTDITLTLSGLTHDGRGVGDYQGKKVFVGGGLPNEIVRARIVNRGKHFDEAVCLEVVQPSEQRVTPQCPLYNTCGGCQLQHLSAEGQRDWKQRNFFHELFRALSPTPSQRCEEVAPLVGEAYGYRRRAKFVVGRDKTDKQAKMGFRQARSEAFVDISQCPILTEALNKHLPAQRETLLPTASRQLQSWMGVSADNGVFWTKVDDKVREKTDENLKNVQNPQSCPSESQELPWYALANLKLYFEPSGFIQVNAQVNQQMVAQALNWLQLDAKSQVLDLFCGIGNFTLPMAQQAKKVVGVEGVASLVKQAHYNAVVNGLANATFAQADLFAEDFLSAPWFKGQRYDAVLLDPGRAGALKVCEHLGRTQAKRIVYVSCHVATLVRDLKVLASQGYVLRKAGMVDMFPQTYHSEAMVLLERKTPKKPRQNKRIFRM